jgi:hypothetical protein
VGASAWLFIVRFSPEEVKKASLSSILRGDWRRNLTASLGTCTSTVNAIFGFSYGAKATNQVWGAR